MMKIVERKLHQIALCADDFKFFIPLLAELRASLGLAANSFLRQRDKQNTNNHYYCTR